MKRLIAIITLCAFLVGASGCASEKVLIDGKAYSANKINKKPSTSY